MSNNPFIQSLEIPELRQPSPAYVPTQYIAYHGSPFSPEDMSIVFERNGYKNSWAILPTQSYHINEAGTDVEPFGDGPSVSAGSWHDARARAFLNKYADQYIGLENDSGFSSAGILDSYGQPIATIPRVVADRLTEHQPEGFIYTVDIYQEGFAPAEFATQQDRERDRYEHRTGFKVYPVATYTMPFAEFVAGKSVLVVDSHFSDIKAAEQDIAGMRAEGRYLFKGEEAVAEHFRSRGIATQMLAEM